MTKYESTVFYFVLAVLLFSILSGFLLENAVWAHVVATVALIIIALIVLITRVKRKNDLEQSEVIFEEER